MVLTIKLKERCLGIVCKLCQSTCTGFSLQFSTLAASWKEFDDDLLNDTHIENWGKERKLLGMLTCTCTCRDQDPLFHGGKKSRGTHHFQTLFFYTTTELHAGHFIFFNRYLLSSFMRGLSHRQYATVLPTSQNNRKKQPRMI